MVLDNTFLVRHELLDVVDSLPSLFACMFGLLEFHVYNNEIELLKDRVKENRTFGH